MKRTTQLVLIFVGALLIALSMKCTFKIDVPPWPDGGLVELPPVQVPCVENREAGWYCVWPDGGAGK